VKNQVQLITYVDRLTAGGIKDLAALLDGPLAGVFGGAHLLPFFNPIDGSDAGFDPIDHTSIDARLGDWSDLERLSRKTELMADLIVNHVSSKSKQFRDFQQKGSASIYAGLFLTADRVFPAGPTAEELQRIYRPRPGAPFTQLTLATGETKQLWTTFTSQQVDIDVTHPLGKAYLESILQRFREGGVKMIRLDAAGYAIKKAGTSCFMLPETYEFIGKLSERARALGMEVLVEIHSYYREQIQIAKRVDRVYDFALPPLVLHALYQADAAPLKAWLAISPRNAVTVLDTHDGIGVIDVGADAATGRAGLLKPEQIDQLVETMHARSGGESRKATGAAASNLDLYQVNSTYYDVLGRDDLAYLAARAIQFFAPGIPQVYYIGLLGETNDMALLERSKVGRDINRHYFTHSELSLALQRPVVKALLRLIRLRNAHPAFNGSFQVRPCEDHQLHLRWERGEQHAELLANLEIMQVTLRLSSPSGEECFTLGTLLEEAQRA